LTRVVCSSAKISGIVKVFSVHKTLVHEVSSIGLIARDFMPSSFDGCERVLVKNFMLSGVPAIDSPFVPLFDSLDRV
jgi:hypothetical protein